MTKEEIEKLNKRNLANIWCYCTNCKHYHEVKEVEGLELGKKGRMKKKIYTVIDWCDYSKQSMRALTYLCEFFDPAITKKEFNKLKGKK